MKNKTRHLHFKKVWPFKKARAFVRKLHLNGAREWKTFIRLESSQNIKIPVYPYRFASYKKQWKNWGNFLGKENKKVRKYYINDNFFSKWSHNMAYVFGIWFADGCIVKAKKSNTYIFNITQHKKDKYLLENILKSMKSNYPICLDKRNNGSCYFIQINSPQIVKDIIRLGGKYRKSLDCKFPYIPKKYLPDFIRGLFDGDGCIWYDKAIKSYRSSFSSGSIDFVAKLLNILRKNILNFKSNSNKYGLYCATNDTKKLGIFMYQNNPKLKMLRKYDLFKKAGTKVKEFWPYEKVKKYVKKFNIKSESKWRIYYKSGKKPIQIPSCPDRAYKNKGWTNWTDYLGYKIKRKIINLKE